MARTRTLQNSFNAGEWSPLLEGRTDLAQYQSAVKTLENFIAVKYGGVKRRPGTRYVAEVKDSSKATRLIPFIFSDTQAYIVEVGNLYMRFYKDGGRIESGGAVEISTPYVEADLFDLQFTQSADTVYIAHGSYAPRKLTRTSHTAWSLTAITFVDGPWDGVENTLPQFTPSATTGAGITITSGSAFFESGMVGLYIRLKHSTTWGYALITGYTNSTTVTATVIDDFGDTTASDARMLSDWGDYYGWPKTVTLYQQRSFWGGTATNPDTVWGSVVGDYETFSPGTAAADEAIKFTLASNKVNVIRWLAPSRALIIGTSGQEWQVTGTGGADDPIIPGGILARPETTHGSSTVAPVQIHNAALFLQRAGHTVRELSFSLDTDSYVAPDLTLLAEHMARGYTIVQMDYQEELDSILWAVRSDGQLLGMTYERPQQVLGWHRHIPAGTDAAFESVAVIPHPDADQDQVWVIIKRTIDGGTVRYVEYLDTKGGYYGDLTVDSGLSYSGAATATLTGLDHLEGETVDVVGNGAVYPQKTVSSGQITGLDPEVTEADVGLHFDSDLVTMRPEVVQGSGTSQNALKRFNSAAVRLYQSLGGTINGEQLSYRKPSDLMGTPPALVTDDVRVTNLGWDRDGRIEIQQQQPLPMTVLALIGVLNTEG